MSQSNYIKLSTVVLAVLIPCVVYAHDACPCEGGTKPVVGKDACGNDTCYEELVGLYPWTTACDEGTCDSSMGGAYPYKDACGKGVCEKPDESEKCCAVANKIYNPDKETSVGSTSVNLTKGVKILDEVARKIKSVSGVGAISVVRQPAGNLTGSINHTYKSECCPDSLKDLHKYEGSLDLNFGGIGIQFGPDWKVAKCAVTASVTASHASTVDKEQNCEGKFGDGKLNGTITVSGNGDIAVEAGDYIKISGEVSVTGSGNFKFDLTGGGTSGGTIQGCFTVTAGATFRLFDDLINTTPYTTRLYNACTEEYAL